MIRYLKNHQIDAEKWDDCIRQSFNGNPCAFSWYLDLVHPDWEALVENDYDRVMPLTAGRKFGVSYLFQPFFTQQLGVFSRSKLNPGIVEEFIRSIPGHFRLVEINLNSFNKCKTGCGTIVRNKNYVLDLINAYPKIYKKYTTNTKRNLKKGVASKLSVVKSIKPDELVRLFRNNRGKTLKKWKDPHYNTLQRIMYTAIHKGKGVLYGVYSERNELVAGAFFLKHSNRIVFLFSGADETAKKTGAMPLLIDHVIREYAPSKNVFDFEGSNDPQLARFYRGFGAKKISYPGLQINRLPLVLKQIFLVYKRFRP